MSLPAARRARLILGNPPVGNHPSQRWPLAPHDMPAGQWSQGLVQAVAPHLRALLLRRDLLDTGIPGPRYKGDGGGAGLERRKKRRKKTKASEAPTPDGSSDRGEVQPLAGGSEVGLASRKTQRKTTEPGMTHATDGSSNMEEAQSLAGDGTEAGSRSVSLG